MRSVLTTSALFALLCFVGLVSMLFSTISLIGSLSIGSSPGSLFEACCGTVLARLSVGWLLFAAVGLAAMLVLVRLARSLWRLLGSTRRVRGLRRVSERTTIDGYPCRVFEVKHPVAFCAGLIRPEIFVSRGALRAVSPEVLSVVLAHEDQHRKSRDPLRKAATKTLAESFFFLPVIGQVGQKYLALTEIRADRAAAAIAPRGSGDVAEALLAFPAGGQSRSTPSTSAHRIDDLSGTTGTWAPSRTMLIATLVALAALLSAPVISVELITSVPVGFEALGLHVCLLVLTSMPIILAAFTFWSRPSFQLR